MEDGGLILHITTRNEPELMAWVLSFGAKAEVLHAEWLRHEIRTEAQSIIHQLDKNIL